MRKIPLFRLTCEFACLRDTTDGSLRALVLRKAAFLAVETAPDPSSRSCLTGDRPYDSATPPLNLGTLCRNNAKTVAKEQLAEPLLNVGRKTGNPEKPEHLLHLVISEANPAAPMPDPHQDAQSTFGLQYAGYFQKIVVRIGP